MAFLRLSMQSSASFPTDSNFYRPVERNQMLCASTLSLGVYEKVINEPTLIEYEDLDKKKALPHWLSPNYIDLHMRSARLVSCEAKSALNRHFAQPRKSKEKRRGGEMIEVEGTNSDDTLWLSIFEERSFLDEPFC